MKIGNIEVKQVADGVITIQQHGEDESRCHVSKASDAEVKSESIKGSYLHMLAGAVAKMENLNDRQILMIAREQEMFQVLDNGRLKESEVIAFAEAIIKATLEGCNG